MDFNQLLGQAGLGQALPGAYYPIHIDNRTDRQRLEDKLSNNCSKILDLEKENEEVKEALKLLDEHPIIEKMNNLIKKLIGK